MRKREHRQACEHERGADRTATPDSLVEHERTEHGCRERLCEHERGHLRRVEPQEAASEEHIRDCGRHEAEVQREGDAVRGVGPVPSCR